jgi:hypothetical protein
MKVKAIALGFYGGKRRRVDEEFDVPDGTKSKWFEPVTKEAKGKGKKEAEKSPETLSELSAVTHKDQGNALV